MFNKLIGIGLIISAFVVEAMWLGACFGTVVVGIVLLLFAPAILLLPFNVLFAMGVGFLAYDKGQGSNYESYNYHDTDTEQEEYSNVNPLEKYYDVLGCDSSDDFETIKKAYKDLSKQYHPDAVEGKGLGESFVSFATQKMQEINEAYQVIKKQRATHAL